ncbi:MAG: nitrogenase component 1 [Bacillota bacterium]
MALTRFLPTPSDRMGILWTLLQIEDAVILEYGTQGTTAYAMKTYSLMGMSVANKLFSTGLNENDVVMGDTASLEKKIVELDRNLSPKAIFVMASSVSSMTGADVKGVCHYMQKSVNARLVVFTQGGFNGDYSSGIDACYTDLIAKFSVNKYEKTNTYNILGISSAESSAKNDVVQIKNAMKKHFGLLPQAVLAFETNLTKIQEMSQASINIVLSYEGLKGAEILKERFGTPYVYILPVGERATNEWLTEIATILDVKYEYKEETPQNHIDRKVLIYASYDKAVAIRKEMIARGCSEIDTICTHKIKQQADIRYISGEKEKILLFRSASNAIIFADDGMLNLSNNSNTKINLSRSESVFQHNLLPIKKHH